MIRKYSDDQGFEIMQGPGTLWDMLKLIILFQQQNTMRVRYGFVCRWLGNLVAAPIYGLCLLGAGQRPHLILVKRRRLVGGISLSSSGMLEFGALTNKPEMKRQALRLLLIEIDLLLKDCSLHTILAWTGNEAIVKAARRRGFIDTGHCYYMTTAQLGPLTFSWPMKHRMKLPLLRVHTQRIALYCRPQLSQA